MYVVKKTIYAERNSQKSTLGITQYCKSQQTPGSTQCWGSAGTAPKTWTNTEPTQSEYPPSKHGTPAQRRTTVHYAGPTSAQTPGGRPAPAGLCSLEPNISVTLSTKESYLSLYIVTNMTPIPQMKII